MDSLVTSSEQRNISIPARIFSVFFSYLFHPVFIPLYVAWFICYIHPSAFSGFSDSQRKQVLLIIALNAVFFPLFSIVLLKAVGFIQSIRLVTQKDRIIPYIACGIFFFWTYIIFKEQAQYPRILAAFIFGTFLSASAGLLVNIYFKISMHAMAMGGWVGIFLLIFRQNSMLMTWPLAIVILLTGAVCTARLLVSDHSPRDIYAGILTGLLCQVIAGITLL
jgi:hypothetical protein